MALGLESLFPLSWWAGGFEWPEWLEWAVALGATVSPRARTTAAAGRPRRRVRRSCPRPLPSLIGHVTTGRVELERWGPLGTRRPG
jgi:hypothetical protein